MKLEIDRATVNLSTMNPVNRVLSKARFNKINPPQEGHSTHGVNVA